MAVPTTFKSFRFDKGNRLTICYGENESVYSKSTEKFDPGEAVVKSVTFEKGQAATRSC
eukprot:TRINITY_DN2029_c0_g1_i1.p2 TRINITY_DN2029_c0_g1~~TRINITY_DN2029_c0_g1_i1.p2  ORF type:complete len:59 (-),score=11.73 TRINITY_DN2029_c0_g1_i1:60-236(-)